MYFQKNNILDLSLSIPLPLPHATNLEHKCVHSFFENLDFQEILYFDTKNRDSS
jgi:hypothetical protein